MSERNDDQAPRPEEDGKGLLEALENSTQGLSDDWLFPGATGRKRSSPLTPNDELDRQSAG